VLPIIEATFKDVILETEAKERVILLAQATRNTKLSQAPYRHVLLHGPPGTGKTLIGG
jgi:ATPase family AAA domain-containing protein 3A/B